MKDLVISMWVKLMEGIENPTLMYAPLRVYDFDSQLKGALLGAGGFFTF